MRKIIPAEIDKWTKVAIEARMPRTDRNLGGAATSASVPTGIASDVPSDTMPKEGS